MTSLPLCVGFGIKDAQSASEIAALADGVVVETVEEQGAVRHRVETEDVAGVVNALSSEQIALPLTALKE